MMLLAKTVTLFDRADQLLKAMQPAIRGMLLLMLGATLWLALDRSPPFAMLQPEYPPPTVQPGQDVALRANVRRDVERNCSATMDRFVHFVDGRRQDLPQRRYTAQAIADMEAVSPGRMAPVISVPDWAPPGRATLHTTLYYRCNVTHDFKPIVVVLYLPFEVVAPPPKPHE